MACNIEVDVKGAGAEDGTLIPTFLSHDNLKSQSSLRQQFWEPLHHLKEWKCLMFKINMYFCKCIVRNTKNFQVNWHINLVMIL